MGINTVKQEGIGLLKELALKLEMPALDITVDDVVLNASEVVKQNETHVEFKNRVIIAKSDKKRVDSELF